jgi:hypothetical protein
MFTGRGPWARCRNLPGLLPAAALSDAVKCACGLNADAVAVAEAEASTSVKLEAENQNAQRRRMLKVAYTM